MRYGFMREVVAGPLGRNEHSVQRQERETVWGRLEVEPGEGGLSQEDPSSTGWGTATPRGQGGGP